MKYVEIVLGMTCKIGVSARAVLPLVIAAAAHAAAPVAKKPRRDRF